MRSFKRAIGVPAVALLALGGTALAVVSTSAPAGATTTVHNAGELQTAFDSAETNIVLANDITTSGAMHRSNTFGGDVTIDGAGFTITSDGSDRILTDDGAGSLTLVNITLTAGNIDDDGGAVYAEGPVVAQSAQFVANTNTDGQGGAIYSATSVTSTGSTFTNNVSYSDGGGVASDGPVTVTGSTFTGNTTEDNGGGVFSDNGPVEISGSTFANNQADENIGGYGDGGGAFTYGSMDITASSFTGNFTTGNDDFGGGGAEALEGLTITDSTFAGNSAEYVGGGVYSDSTLSVARSTFTGNCAQYGGAIEQGIGEKGNGDTSIANSTITANTQSLGDSAIGLFGGDATVAYSTITANVNDPTTTCGLPVQEESTAKGSDHRPANAHAATVRPRTQDDGGAANFRNTSTATFFATVVTGAVGGPNCLVESLTSQGYNWSDDTSCQLTDATDSEATPNDPQLNALGNWGGPTQTMLPLTPLHGGVTSPLIDAVPVAACQTGIGAGITTDQRGVTRPQLVGCDIGAVEVTQADLQVEAAVIQPKFTG